MEAIFVREHEVYEYFHKAGIKIPKFKLISSEDDLKEVPFNNNDKVVIKGIANNLWHKSDEGALFFEDFNASRISELILEAKSKLKDKYPDICFLICERVDFVKSDALPSEAFISFKKDDSLGMTLNFGLGGIYAELWAESLSVGINQWAIELTSFEEAYEDFKNHLIGKVWLGNVRQGKALTTEKILKAFFKSLWKMGEKLIHDNIELLEVNPLVLDHAGNPILLDGVGLKDGQNGKLESSNYNYEKLLAPKKIAIAGVSDKASSFGKKILENLIESEIPHSDLKIIKPGADEFMGIKCFPDVSSLKNDPVDILVLALPAPITVKTLTDLVKQGKGADFVYIVAGGIGDGADKEDYAGTLKNMLKDARNRGEWTPGIIGPNSLGIVLSPKNINTLFLSKERLPISFHKEGNTALVSQSGAFLITRLSSEDTLPLKYGFAIGSQLDLKASDLLELISNDNDISVFGFYFEGFEKNDALKFAKYAKEIIKAGKHVILYKGGRSQSGMKAASGHTGAMAGDYELLEKVFRKVGIIISETMEEFSTSLGLLSSYSRLKESKSLVAITNAGFEAVSCADHFGDTKNIGLEKMLEPIKDSLKYEKLLEEFKLSGLVSPANPFDLTPMASEEVFLKTVEHLTDDYDIIVLSIVPFTERIKALNGEATTQFVKSLAKIRDDSSKVIIVVVDAGELYEEYRQSFSSEGFPVFHTIERPMIVFNKLFH